MKRLLCIILTLLLFALPALAELGSADVAFNGKQYTVTLESVQIKNGKLYLEMGGLAKTMAFTANGLDLAATAVPVYGEEQLIPDEKDILFGKDITYRFDKDTMPDMILLVPTDDSQEPVVLWENTAPEASEGAAIPPELVGNWTGVGTPKNGGTTIGLTITIGEDGTGEYTFDQGGYHESYPFAISNDDSSFSVDIPATSMLGSVAGSWAYEDGVLKLDITSTFTGGGSYSYTAECVKAE